MGQSDRQIAGSVLRERAIIIKGDISDDVILDVFISYDNLSDAKIAEISRKRLGLQRISKTEGGVVGENEVGEIEVGGIGASLKEFHSFQVPIETDRAIDFYYRTIKIKPRGEGYFNIHSVIDQSLSSRSASKSKTVIR